MNLTEIQRGYLAGLFDGEGTIGVYYIKNRHTKCIASKCSIYNTNKEVIEYCRAITGLGTIHSNIKSKTKSSSQICYTWNLGLEDSFILLNEILPSLIIKKQRALLLIELFNIKSVGRRNDLERQNEIVSVMKALNGVKNRGTILRVAASN